MGGQPSIFEQANPNDVFSQAVNFINLRCYNKKFESDQN